MISDIVVVFVEEDVKEASRTHVDFVLGNDHV